MHDQAAVPPSQKSLILHKISDTPEPRIIRYQADDTPYLGRTCTGWIAPACGWRTYSIRWSAVITSVSGMAKPSALAVLRL
jgi:hypothetical protein